MKLQMNLVGQNLSKTTQVLLATVLELSVISHDLQ